MPPETQEALQRLQELISASEQGRIPWVQANPSVFLWDVPNRARTTLQQLAPPPQSPNYILQVVNPQNGMQMLLLKGLDDPNLNTALHKLFSVINSGMNRTGLNFLSSLIPK